ncbi:MAG: hypothetical protein JRJ84_19310 [Deltaproteobacteria bacterium]|nr:hypothetical protein [Deltaproteobacteria bacterium]
MTRRYVHAPLGEEVRAIGGGYTLLKELRLALNGREVLAIIGVGTFDTSCCGTGGCAYALVPGVVLAWKDSAGSDGTPATLVEPVTDPEVRKQLARRLQKDEHVQDVRFWCAEPFIPREEETQ